MACGGTERIRRRQGMGQITRGLSHGGEFGFLSPILMRSCWSILTGREMMSLRISIIKCGFRGDSSTKFVVLR